MKLWKYKIFNISLGKYYPKDYLNIEDLTKDFLVYQRTLIKYKFQYKLEVHKIEVAKIALTIENDI